MIGYSHWILIYSAAAYSKQSIAQVIDNSPIQMIMSGQSLCTASQLITTVGVVHGFVGGVGIALMRSIFIMSVSPPTKPMRIALLITISTIAVTSVVTYLWHNAPKRSQNLVSLCLGRPAALDLTLFNLSSPNSSISFVGRLVAFIGRVFFVHVDPNSG